jgi:hypothetical protein
LVFDLADLYFTSRNTEDSGSFHSLSKRSDISNVFHGMSPSGEYISYLVPQCISLTLRQIQGPVHLGAVLP